MIAPLTRRSSSSFSRVVFFDGSSETGVGRKRPNDGSRVDGIALRNDP